jgi:hypothetical protein
MVAESWADTPKSDAVSDPKMLSWSVMLGDGKT